MLSSEPKIMKPPQKDHFVFGFKDNSHDENSVYVMLNVTYQPNVPFLRYLCDWTRHRRTSIAKHHH